MPATGKKRTPPKKKAKNKSWSAAVSRTSNALDLKEGIFESRSASKIAQSLKSSAVASTRKKGTSFQSAMSMLNFYINRGGKNLSAVKKAILEKAKDKLRMEFDRPVKR